MNRNPMIPSYIDTLLDYLRSGLVALLIAGAFLVFFVVVSAWDFIRAFWDTIICGKSDAEQLRDWTESE